MSTTNPGLQLLERKVDKLGLRREVEDELAQIRIEHKIATLAQEKATSPAKNNVPKAHV
jgi:hypothetical protein